MIELMMAVALMQAPDPCHAAAVPAGRPGCPVWRLLSRTRETSVWMDPASVRRSGSRVEVQTRVVFAQPQGESVRSALMRHAYDCTRRTGATLHISLYDAAGAMVDEQPMTGEDAAPAAPEPGSPDAIVLARLCPR